MSACPILAGVTKYRNFECSITQRILKYVSDSESIKTVILSGRGPTHMTGKGFGEIENHIDARMVTSLNTSLKDSKEIYKISLFETVRKLQSSGKKVILISDNPELGFDPKACGNQRPFRLTYYGVKNPCAVSRREFDERNQDYHKILDYISDSFPINEVKIWEPWKQLCDQYWCWAIKDGKLMYRDGNHLNPEGSKWLGERFAPK
ncbi:acyltransferase [Leptospira johnsonii]|uniref:Acyltransferase n=2 Tax=Leptospira johnsonii TaxID=1917820 RepID=A0A2P2CYL1_9LEPT|nr:acyltransferase [Leptospira johnsonii]